MTEGVLNVLKPSGMTSHDVVYHIKKIFSESRVGHGGTLDPQASGVLIVCIGQATRLLEWALSDRKQYLAEMTLGIATDTQDCWGKALKSMNWEFIESIDIHSTAESFVLPRQYIQLVPEYSAVKIDGVPMYKRARQGIKNSERFRETVIHQLQILQISNNKVKFLVDCSKGTYIRTLCNDWGERLGVGAHLSFLLRVSTGDFSIDESYSLEEIQELKEKALIPKERLIRQMNKITLNEIDTGKIQQGRMIEIAGSNQNNGDKIAVMTNSGCLIAICGIHSRTEGIFLKPLKVFHQKGLDA